MAKDFLIEVGTEELPPKALKILAHAFCEGVTTRLNECALSFEQARWFATPRRLAVQVTSLIETAPDKAFEIHGPPVGAAKDKQGNWTKAAEGFAAKHNTTPDQLSVVNTNKGERLAVSGTAAGENAMECLPDIVTESIKQLPVPKRMRWGTGDDEFVRPVQWAVMLYGDKIIPATILGVQTSNQTRGHRFHCNTTLDIANPSVYEKILAESGHVIADFDKRQQLIKQQITVEAQKLNGTALINDDLLDEVTAIVEWPRALSGTFEQSFLEVPPEALISTMQDNQKYFPVVDKDGRLLNHFIFVANIDSADPPQVIEGNERVIRPRFSDAAFFFDTDKKRSLEQRLEKLKTVVFQQKLGTVYDKSQRVSELAAYIANDIGGDPTLAKRAGLLAKADLASDMVLEFETMQGIAGYYYAINDGENADVAVAIRDQYLPKFAGDSLPDNLIACAVGLADRLDTLVGIFGIGQSPTGSKDPFALRRASLSVLRILVENELALDLRDLLQRALKQHKDLPQDQAIVELVLVYMIDRFRAWYEEDGIAIQIFQAVSANDISKPLDFNIRVKAVHAFAKLPEAESLAAANKRVSNILSKHTGKIPERVDAGLLQEPSEKALATAVANKAKEVSPLFANHQYEQGLKSLASVRDVVDEFFDNVMVNVDDHAVRDNRLALLTQLRQLFLQVADISLLAGSVH